MGAWIRNNFINISDETRKGVLVGGFSYKDIDDKFISEICSNDKIQVIQISKALPKEAFIKIDSILEKKPELDFRIFSITSLNRCDISFLENISNYDVWDYNQIEEKTAIKYSKKQMLVALSYGKNHVTSLPIKELETNKKIKNDYTCIFSIKFK